MTYRFFSKKYISGLSVASSQRKKRSRIRLSKVMAISLALLSIGSLQLSGQSCTTATCTAATVNEADVLAALPSNSNANATVVVNIPAGTGLWTSQLTYTIPTAVTSLTIQGATSVNCTGTVGTSSYACTPTDATIIQDNVAGSFGLWQFFGSAGANPLLRFTGITLQGGTGLSKGQGLFLLYSQNNGSQIRFDHNHINETTYTGGPGTFAGRINGCWTGVIDHNVFDNASTSSTTSVVQGFDASNACSDSLGYGDGSWAFATGYGTSNFLFQESNVFNGGLEGDCDTGGKFVSRYNTLNSNSQSSSWVHSHGTEQNGGRARGCRAYEAYHDYFNVAGSGSVLFGGDAGTSIAWGNTVNHTTALFSSYGDERNDGGHPQTAPPNGWGFCGTTAGGGSAWDGNSNTASGWPCLDGLGRGQGQALNGTNFPGALNSVTGTIAWPHQNLEPVYQWMNTLAGTPQITISGTAAIQNRDLFVDNASFNGTTGTGFGLLSARPATCTAGPGGTFGTSPTGSYGVGYWATDTNTFYVCSSTNTWTSIYTPYTYPHPLTVGGGVALTVSATNGSVSGANGSTGSYASGTTVGPLSATPNTGYSFAGWSSTGSASCSGTGTCGPFSLTATTSITASFTLNSWTLTTATAGSGSGTIAGCSGAHNYASSYSCTVTPSAGSSITSVSGCGGSGTTTFTGTMPNNACTVTATFSNTLATPTFTPPAGTYGSAQWVTINSPAGTSVFNATEGSNGNSSNGDAPSRNLYTNCAEGWNGSALTPTGVPVGDLYCNATDKAAAIAAGGPNLGVVTSANSGTGIHAVQNGQDAGGTDSAASLTATYGQANQNGCPIGTNVSTSIPGVTLPGNVSAANTTYGITTQSGNFNTSLLAPTKWTYSGGDSGLYWVRETCQKVNTTSVAGEHLEYDANYNTTAGVYIGQGWDFDFPNSKFRFDPQGGSWHNVKLVANDGTVATTYSWPANHWIYTQIWMHHVAACNTGPASGCTFFYDQLCVKDFTAGTPLACYNLIDANTNLTPTGTAVSKTTWTRNEFALQHQWDVNGSSATLTNTVDFDNLVAFSFAPNVFYTVDGSTPTTGSTPYYLPVAVPSNLTIKALANQSGFTNSTVGSAAYVISPSNTLTTSATNGSVSGSNCATGSYATGSSIGACTATPNAGYTFSGWSGSGACSGASGTGTASCTLSSNATLTASFAPILTCGDPSQLSPNFSGTYIVPPTTLPMTVGFTSPTSGCAMHYTSDGSSPTCGSTAYPGGNFSITVAGTYQYRVIACQGGYTSSAVVGGTWQVNAASGTTSVMGGTLTLSGQQGVQ